MNVQRVCPCCQNVLDIHAVASGCASGCKDQVPATGDLTVCGGCLAVLRFEKDGGMQPLEASAMEKLDPFTLKSLIQARAAVLGLRQRLGRA